MAWAHQKGSLLSSGIRPKDNFSEQIIDESDNSDSN